MRRYLTLKWAVFDGNEKRLKKYKVDTSLDKQYYCHKQIFLLNLHLKKKNVLIIKVENFVIDPYKNTIPLLTIYCVCFCNGIHQNQTMKTSKALYLLIFIMYSVYMSLTTNFGPIFMNTKWQIILMQPEITDYQQIILIQ